MLVWIPLSERKRLKSLGYTGRVRYPRPALIEAKLRSCGGTALSDRTVDEYYDLLCQEVIARKNK